MIGWMGDNGRTTNAMNSTKKSFEGKYMAFVVLPWQGDLAGVMSGDVGINLAL